MADAKVLIVDDVESNLFVVRKLMLSYGLTVDTATSGQEAIERIKGGGAYDIVFMDHMMPEMDGIEAAKKIREMGIETPIIALTANDAEGSREMFLAEGLNEMLSKPVNKAALEKILADWIKPGNAGAARNDAPAESGAGTALWKKIEQIPGLSVQIGLDRVSGQRDVYEKLLKLTVREFDNHLHNLNNFLAAGDLKGFSIEVHGLKSALANIGVMELSARARELEDASGGGDAAFCTENLPRFLEGLGSLNTSLVGIFSEDAASRGPVELPPELPKIFDRLKAAFEKNDFAAIDDGMESLNALNSAGALKAEIDKINEAVLMIDYDGALNVMRKLLA